MTIALIILVLGCFTVACGVGVGWLWDRSERWD